MCKWFKEYDEAAKNIRDKGLSSDQYKIRIMDLKMYMIIFTVILVPVSFLGFFMYKNVWWVGLVPLTIVAVLDTIAYRGIKSLKKDYELALFREKQKKKRRKKVKTIKTKNKKIIATILFFICSLFLQQFSEAVHHGGLMFQKRVRVAV